MKAFIRNNTKELRDKLFELGYILDFHRDLELDEAIVINYRNRVAMGTSIAWCTTFGLKLGFRDCGSNEQMFLNFAKDE